MAAIAIILVVLLNIIIYIGAKSENTANQIDLFKRAFSQIRNPWEREDDMLIELSEKVKQLQDNDQGQDEVIEGE